VIKYFCGECEEELSIEKRIRVFTFSENNPDLMVIKCPSCGFENQFIWSDEDERERERKNN
jgi:RNase P subunit RPR2